MPVTVGAGGRSGPASGRSKSSVRGKSSVARAESSARTTNSSVRKEFSGARPKSTERAKPGLREKSSVARPKPTERAKPSLREQSIAESSSNGSSRQSFLAESSRESPPALNLDTSSSLVEENFVPKRRKLHVPPGGEQVETGICPEDRKAVRFRGDARPLCFPSTSANSKRTPSHLATACCLQFSEKYPAFLCSYVRIQCSATPKVTRTQIKNYSPSDEYETLVQDPSIDEGGDDRIKWDYDKRRAYGGDVSSML